MGTAITGVIASQAGIDINIDPEAITGLVIAAITGTEIYWPGSLHPTVASITISASKI